MTYADLPAPALIWEQMPSAPVPRLDGYSIQINDSLFVFAGYANLDHVNILISLVIPFFLLVTLGNANIVP